MFSVFHLDKSIISPKFLAVESYPLITPDTAGIHFLSSNLWTPNVFSIHCLLHLIQLIHKQTLSVEDIMEEKKVFACDS